MVGARRGAGFLALLALTVAAGAAWAAEPALGVKVREAVPDGDGTVRLTVSVTGTAAEGVLDPASFQVTEEGQPVELTKVQPLVESRVQPVAVALAMDVSGSTRGRPIQDAKAAARSFVAELPAPVAVALFVFGSGAEQKVDFTTDRELLASAIDSLQPGGETALYEAVSMAASALAGVEGQRNVVVFSDGRDTVRRTTLDEAVTAAREAKAPVTSVGLETPDFDPGALERLAAETGGRLQMVDRSGDLSGAFGQVAREIASQYVLTYSSSRVDPKELDIVVRVAAGGESAEDSVTVLNPRVGAAPPVPPPTPEPEPARAVFGSRVVFYAAMLGVFAALSILLGVLLHRPGGGALRLLRRGLVVHTRGAAGEPESGLLSSGFGRKAVELLQQVPKPKGFEDRLQLRLDQAGWPVRAGEFLVLEVVAALVAGLLAYGVFGNWFVALLLAAAGAVLPHAVLHRQIERRTSAFVGQLPDTLQLLAASLQAGYGLLQAIDTVTKESDPPTSAEFSRVLTEARLGMPLEDALESMADRVGSDDFRWAVLAINIQRQVGGNLATLLETVANTIRERDELRRHVKVLSAEGRLSALVLSILPFALAGYMAVVNPGYVAALLSSGFGRLMVFGALGAMSVGIAWMRRLVKVQV